MKDIEDRVAAFLMEYGILKNRDADKMAKKIAGMFEKEREELQKKLSTTETVLKHNLEHAKCSKCGDSNMLLYCQDCYDNQRAKLATKCAEIDSPTWPWVRGFASEMERKLAENRHKGDRDGWSSDSPEALFARLKEEVAELHGAIFAGTQKAVRGEAADVANFAMMIADVAGGLEPHKQDGSGWLSPSEREKLEGLLNCAKSQGAQMLDCIKSNHKWHQEYDEYEGYPDSELCEKNVAALSLSCGDGWLSPEKAGRLREALKSITLLEWNEENAIDYWRQAHDIAILALSETK